MSLLFRYLTKNNAMILLPTLAVGIGLYVLTDLFERLDNFIEAGLSVGMVLCIFILSQGRLSIENRMDFYSSAHSFISGVNAVSCTFNSKHSMFFPSFF